MASIPTLIKSAQDWLTFMVKWIGGDENTVVEDPDGETQDSPRKRVQALIDSAEADIAADVAGLSISSFGTTANRPNLGSGVRYVYFDDTLGKPVFWDGTGWVDATGTTA